MRRGHKEIQDGGLNVGGVVAVVKESGVGGVMMEVRRPRES
jgi:hypothetical protein